MNTCPVCGYSELEEPPERFNICPSCGTEFGSDDFVFDANDYPAKLAELRARWLLAGAPWFDDETPRPPNWKPYEKAATVGMTFTVTEATTQAEPDYRSFFVRWDVVPTEPRRVESVGTKKELARVA